MSRVAHKQYSGTLLESPMVSTSSSGDTLAWRTMCPWDPLTPANDPALSPERVSLAPLKVFLPEKNFTLVTTLFSALIWQRRLPVLTWSIKKASQTESNKLLFTFFNSISKSKWKDLECLWKQRHYLIFPTERKQARVRCINIDGSRGWGKMMSYLKEPQTKGSSLLWPQ